MIIITIDVDGQRVRTPENDPMRELLNDIDERGLPPLKPERDNEDADR